MKVLGLVWLGMRTEKFDATVDLLTSVMGIPIVRREPNLAGFEVPDSFAMEVFRPEDEFHSFFTTGPVVGFLVDDVEGARREMEAAGVEFIGPIQTDGRTRWNHFRMPDGTVCEIKSGA